MDFDITLFGMGMIVFILVVGVLSYSLGKRKTTTPKMAVVIGVVLSTIPPLALIYLAFLFFKKDIEQTKA